MKAIIFNDVKCPPKKRYENETESEFDKIMAQAQHIYRVGEKMPKKDPRFANWYRQII